MSVVRRRLGTLLALPCAVAALAAAPAGAAPLDRLVGGQLRHAGGASSAFVFDTTTGQTLAAVRADVPRLPASVEKLYTTSTALLRFGATGTLETTVLGDGVLDPDGTWQGDLYLRGGGDPTFGSAAFDRRAYGAGATIEQLADAVSAAGIRRVTGTLYGDESWFDRLRGGPSTGFGLDVAELGGPLSALLFDRGLAKEDGSATAQRQPAKFVAKRLAAALKAVGVRVAGGIGSAPAPAGATTVASVSSLPIATLARLTLVPSDNFLAEMLLKAIGARFGSAGSTAAGAAVVRRTVARFGIHPTVVDGSGLSRSDRTTPRQVVMLLAAMRDQPGFRAALAVPGRDGTLALRMRRTSAQSRCQAKTGTLSNVSALAGYCRTANGHTLAFAFLQNLVVTWRAKAIEDRLTVALARSRPVDATAPPPSSPSQPPVPTGGGASPAQSG